MSSAQRGKATRLAHIAIAVRDAEAVATLFTSALAAVRGAEEVVDNGALRVVFLHVGDVTFELLEPRSDQHTVAGFLAQRGEGIHHVSLEVEDVKAALQRCRKAGVQPIDETPRPGADGRRVAFLHPKSLAGVLIELCQRSEPDTTPRGD
jgi:methylmalonyl-CoA/ethylmalonyl-CoA epimerase